MVPGHSLPSPPSPESGDHPGAEQQPVDADVVATEPQHQAKFIDRGCYGPEGECTTLGTATVALASKWWRTLEVAERPSFDYTCEVLQDCANSLSWGRRPSGESLQVHASNEKYAVRRDRVVFHVTGVTHSLGRLVNQEYIVHIAQHYLDVVLHSQPNMQEQDFHTWSVTAAFIAVKLNCTQFPVLSAISKHFSISADLLRHQELELLKLLDFSTHVVTMWDQLTAWGLLLEHLRGGQGVRLFDLAAIVLTEGVQEDVYNTDISVKKGVGLAALLHSASEDKTKDMSGSHPALRALEEVMKEEIYAQDFGVRKEVRRFLELVPCSAEMFGRQVDDREFVPTAFDFVRYNVSSFREFPPSVVMLCCLLVAATPNVENTAHSTEQIQEMWGVLKRCCRPLSQVWFLSVKETS